VIDGKLIRLSAARSAAFCCPLSCLCCFRPKSANPQDDCRKRGGSAKWSKDNFSPSPKPCRNRKYSFIPTAGKFDGVRSFAEQVKQAACAQFALFNEIEGKTPPAECYAGPSTRLGIAVTAVWHITDHYGEIVEYLRMNGIAPPAIAKLQITGQVRSCSLTLTC
jgi:hypothetical protein